MNSRSRETLVITVCGIPRSAAACPWHNEVRNAHDAHFPARQQRFAHGRVRYNSLTGRAGGDRIGENFWHSFRWSGQGAPKARDRGGSKGGWPHHRRSLGRPWGSHVKVRPSCRDRLARMQLVVEMYPSSMSATGRPRRGNAQRGNSSCARGSPVRTCFSRSFSVLSSGNWSNS